MTMAAVPDEKLRPPSIRPLTGQTAAVHPDRRGSGAGPELSNTDGGLMSKATLSSKLAASRWEPKFPFDLVVAYEDSETRKRTLHLYDHLAQQLLDDYDFQCSWWKFDHLTNPTLRQQAADSAVDANMVILSIRAHKDLPPTHKLWLEDWISRRHHRTAALVVMIAG